MNFFRNKNKTRITDSAVYWQLDLTDRIKTLSRGNIHLSEDWTVSMEVEADVRNKLDKHGLVDVLQDMVTEAQHISDRAAREIVSIWTAYANKGVRRRLSPVEQILVMEEKVSRRKRFNRRSEAVVARLKSELETIPNKHWERFKRVKKDYRNYKIKSGFKVGATTGGLALAIGSTAASVPTGGASIVITVIGIQRTVFSLVEQIRDLSYEGETVLRKLAEDIESLERTAGQKGGGHHSSSGHSRRRHRHHHHHANKGALRAREVGSNLVKAGMGGLNPTASINGCSSNFDLLKNKTNGVLRKSNQLAAKINELLDATEKLNAELAARTFTPAKRMKVDGLVEANEASIHATIKKCVETRERWTSLSMSLPRLNRRIENLRGTAGAGFVKGAAFIPVLVDIGLAGWGAGDAFSGAEQTWQFATSAVSSLNDLISLSTDVHDTALG